MSPEEPGKRASDGRLRPDGRRLRSLRTKQLIIEAYLALAHELSPSAPTAVQTAARAGCWVRSVFERFPDLRALQVAATDYAMAQSEALSPLWPLDGSREARLQRHTTLRGEACERWLPLWRALVANQGDSLELEQRVLTMRRRSLERAEQVYRFELATLPPEERRDVLLAIEAIIDFETWGRMREQYGLSFEASCDAWRFALDRILPEAPAILDAPAGQA